MFSYSGLVSIREHNFIHTPHIDSSHRWLFPLVAQEMVTHENLNKMGDISNSNCIFLNENIGILN